VDGGYFIVMAYVHGKSLAASLRERTTALPAKQAALIMRKLALALSAAHAKGIIHRDLKPSNIMIDRERKDVVIMDFGLARRRKQGDAKLTQEGAILGTPAYMAPEQARGDLQAIGPASDIYGLGIILYEMLAVVVPFTGKSVFEVMVQRIQKPPRPIAELNPQTPGYLQKILGRCLAVDPTLRYQSAGEILADLDSGSFRPTLRYEIRRRQWLRPAVAGVVIAVLLAGAGWWLYRRGRAAKPAAPQATQSVLIADFANRTGDAVFDGTLEPAFSIAIEGASFVTSYSRNQARKVAAQLQPGATGLDETLARLVAVREGIDVVTSGAVERSGDGYEVSVRAVDGRQSARGPGRHDPRVGPARRRRDVHGRLARGGARVRRGPGPSVGGQLGRGDPPLPEGAGPRLQPRPRVGGPRGRREQPGTPPGGGEELQGGPGPDRPHERPREVSDARRLLPDDPESRQRHR
jgi:hypothetical protein